jgi:hypothetical protein
VAESSLVDFSNGFQLVATLLHSFLETRDLSVLGDDQGFLFFQHVFQLAIYLDQFTVLDTAAVHGSVFFVVKGG